MKEAPMIGDQALANDSKSGDAGATAPQSVPTAAPAISLPKGGGAIRGIGEKFAANPVTGIGSLSVPIYTSPGIARRWRWPRVPASPDVQAWAVAREIERRDQAYSRIQLVNTDLHCRLVGHMTSKSHI